MRFTLDNNLLKKKRVAYINELINISNTIIYIFLISFILLYVYTNSKLLFLTERTFT